MNYFYKIDLDNSQVTLLRESKQYETKDLMKYSPLIFNVNKLLNYYSSHLENFSSTISMIKMFPTDDIIVGINCFDELLVKSELIDYLNQNFPQEIKGE